ncbi:MAG: HPF/RaiA family ribosome-associated protein [Kingella oralis]
MQSKAAAQVHLAGKDFHVEASENGDNMYAAIDNMADKLDRALLQYKEKAQNR